MDLAIQLLKFTPVQVFNLAQDYGSDLSEGRWLGIHISLDRKVLR
ncbi:MAG: hypothetical protein RMX96_12470 [Nostoc sp. ChiSLP02]|nr:hypothetical protein [Nostoc sp. ChiSLP02]